VITGGIHLNCGVGASPITTNEGEETTDACGRIAAASWRSEWSHFTLTR